MEDVTTRKCISGKWQNVISIAVVCLFLFNSFSFALPEYPGVSRTTLSAQSVFKPLIDAGINFSAEMEYEIIAGMRLLLAGKTPAAVNGILIESYKDSRDTRKIEFLEIIKKGEDSVTARIGLIGWEDARFEIEYAGAEYPVKNITAKDETKKTRETSKITVPVFYNKKKAKESVLEIEYDPKADNYRDIRLDGRREYVGEICIGKKDFVDILFEVGENAGNRKIVEEIADILGALPETFIPREEKLSILAEILQVSSSDPALIRYPQIEHVKEVAQQFALELKEYQENTKIRRLKVGVFGIGPGDVFYHQWVYAKAIGVNAEYICVEKSGEKLDEAKKIFGHSSDFKFIVQDLFSLNPEDRKWGGKGSFDYVDMLSVMHEIYTYGGLEKRGETTSIEHEKGMEAVKGLMAKAGTMLRDGGQFMMFDGYKPEGDENAVNSVKLSVQAEEAFKCAAENFIIPFSRGRDVEKYKRGDRYELSNSDILEFAGLMRYLIRNGTFEDHRGTYEPGRTMIEVFRYATKSEMSGALKKNGFYLKRYDAYTVYARQQLFEKHIFGMDWGKVPRQKYRTLAVKGKTKTDKPIEVDHPPAKPVRYGKRDRKAICDGVLSGRGRLDGEMLEKERSSGADSSIKDAVFKETPPVKQLTYANVFRENDSIVVTKIDENPELTKMRDLARDADRMTDEYDHVNAAARYLEVLDEFEKSPVFGNVYITALIERVARLLLSDIFDGGDRNRLENVITSLEIAPVTFEDALERLKDPYSFGEAYVLERRPTKEQLRILPSLDFEVVIYFTDGKWKMYRHEQVIAAVSRAYLRNLRENVMKDEKFAVHIHNHREEGFPVATWGDVAFAENNPAALYFIATKGGFVRYDQSRYMIADEPFGSFAWSDMTPAEFRSFLEKAERTKEDIGEGRDDENSFKKEAKILKNGHRDGKELLVETAGYLKGYPVNIHIDLSVIPRRGLKKKEWRSQQEKNMETLAYLIARHDTFGIDARYILEQDADEHYKDDALKILKEKLTALGRLPGVDPGKLLSRIDKPHSGDNVIDINLKNKEAVEKMDHLGSREYVIALNDDTGREAVPVPNYTVASNLGLALAALRIAKEKEGLDKNEYCRTREKVLKTFKSVFLRYGMIKTEEDFMIDELEMMVTGSSATRLYYAVLYALPPMVKGAVKLIDRCHEELQLLLQSA